VGVSVSNPLNSSSPLTGEDKGGGVSFQSFPNPSFQFYKGGQRLKWKTLQSPKNPSNPFLPIDGGGQRWGCHFLILLNLPPHFTGEDKGGGGSTWNFPLKILSFKTKKKKQKLYIKPPLLNWYNLTENAGGFENFFENWLYLNKIQPKGPKGTPPI
jgi:hypothetical protein